MIALYATFIIFVDYRDTIKYFASLEAFIMRKQDPGSLLMEIPVPWSDRPMVIEVPFRLVVTLMIILTIVGDTPQ